MRRRVDLAASLIAEPPVLFLDEPTTGLDPQSRSDVWDLIRELVADGATLVLTTQYLDEADRLADEIVLLDQGRVIATGSPGRAEAADRRPASWRSRPRTASDLEPAGRALHEFADGVVRVEDGRLVMPVERGDPADRRSCARWTSPGWTPPRSSAAIPRSTTCS